MVHVPFLKSFIYKSLSTPTSAPSEFELLMENCSWNHASVMINASAILILLCFLYKFHLQRKNKFDKTQEFLCSVKSWRGLRSSFLMDVLTISGKISVVPLSSMSVLIH